jgi:hypothetical protein
MEPAYAREKASTHCTRGALNVSHTVRLYSNNWENAAVSLKQCHTVHPACHLQDALQEHYTPVSWLLLTREGVSQHKIV